MRPSYRRALRWIVPTVVGVGVVVGGFAAWRIGRIANDLNRARGLIDEAGAQIEAGQIGPAQANLDVAAGLLTGSNAQLHDQPELAIAGIVPVVHQNLASLRATVGVALQLVDGGRRILEVAAPMTDPEGRLQVPLRNGTVPIDIVKAAQREVADLQIALPIGPDAPSSRWLVGPVADAQQRVYGEANRRGTQLTNVSRALEVLADMAGANGPRRYLIAVANTAEMRGAGGMVLSYGVLNSANGTFQLGDFGGIDELELAAPIDPSSVPLPDDYLARWSGLKPTQLWRNATLSPDFQLDAPVLAAMYKAKTGLVADGVIQIDADGLAAVLKGTGPVVAPVIGPVDASNVVATTLNKAYFDFPQRDERQGVLGDVAKATFEALVHGQFTSLRPLGAAVLDAAVKRHIVFWTDKPAIALRAAAFQADGALPDPDTQDYAMVSVENFSGNKLDYYLDSALRITGTRPASGSGALKATVELTNTAPESGTIKEVFGPYGAADRRGHYRGVVTLYLPTGVALARAAPGAGTDQPILGTEAGRTIVSFNVDLGPGASTRVEVDLDVAPRSPDTSYAFSLVPLPRVRPTVVGVQIAGPDGDLTRAAAPLDRPETVRRG
ncbi:MAG: DUF4012 domain-containing protein [Acidimicrobiales bacterium]